jgi:hypothetical protein
MIPARGMAGAGVRDPLFRRYAVREDGTQVTHSTAPEFVRTMVEAATLPLTA